LRTGDLLWAYGIFYSIGRFFIEEIRVDSATINGLKAPEIFALATIAVCWAALIIRHRPGSAAPVAVVADTSGLAEDDEGETEWEDDESIPAAPAYAEGAGEGEEEAEYAVDHDAEGDPTEPVPHAAPVVAQAENGHT
jgi:hypothetical protein